MNNKEASLNYYRIEEAIRYLEQHFLDQPSLDELAEKIHLSPFHFQRIFTEWAGISPKRFLQFLTTNHLKTKLEESKNIEETATLGGLSSASRVYDLFTSLEAVTPQEYKLKGAGITIQYGFHQTPFGLSLIGMTERGICWLSFFASEQEQEEQLDEMKNYWSGSSLHQNNELTEEKISSLFLHTITSSSHLTLLVKGTNFQVKVWEALLKIPSGTVTTYQQLATSIQNPKALQAVGSAVGANHIAWLIPCHRVIRKNGQTGEYRWKSARKKSMIGLEMAKG